MLEARGISRRLGGRLVVQDVSLAVPPGSVLALLGPNGAGKTTLLRILAGLLTPTTGTVLWRGQDLLADPAGRCRIGLLSHQSFLYEGLTARENLEFYAGLYGVRAAAARIRQLLGRVGLQAWVDEPVRTFSRGMLQRLAVCRTLLHDPPVLLLDEPYTGLDPQGAAVVNRLLEESRTAGRAVVAVTHDLEGALGWADQIVVLRRGRVAARGPAGQFSVVMLHRSFTTARGAEGGGAACISGG